MSSSTEEDEDATPFRLPDPLPESRNVSDFYRAQPVLDRRIHIVGLESLGNFIAHSLRGIPNPPPVTLIHSHWNRLNDWNSSQQKIRVVAHEISEEQEGFDAEVSLLRRRYHGKEIMAQHNPEDPDAQISSDGRDATPNLQDGEATEPISSLIVCTRAPYVLQTLAGLKHRLHKDSVVLFLQDGMGTVEEVNQEIFPDPETRPHYMVGVSSHMVYVPSDQPYTTVHAGAGILAVGLLPQERNRGRAPYSPISHFTPAFGAGPAEPRYPVVPDPSMPAAKPSTFTWTPNERYLLRTLLRIPVLCATAFSPPDLLQLQLEKLAVHSIIGPLTVQLDSRNGSILYNYSLTRTIRLLLSEISLVIRSLPELQYIPNVSQRFDPGRLETLVVATAQKTRENISDMLWDVRKGRISEVNYLNGWIVKRGEEQGIRCLMNYMMMHLVKGKGNMIQVEMSEDVPFVDGNTSDGSVGIRSSGVDQSMGGGKQDQAEEEERLDIS
jgi:2-dehydropantoate 2-reductase